MAGLLARPHSADTFLESRTSSPRARCRRRELRPGNGANRQAVPRSPWSVRERNACSTPRPPRRVAYDKGRQHGARSSHFGAECDLPLIAGSPMCLASEVPPGIGPPEGRPYGTASRTVFRGICRKPRLIGIPGCYQKFDQRAQQGLAPPPDVVHELEGPQVQRQPLLGRSRDAVSATTAAATRTPPGS